MKSLLGHGDLLRIWAALRASPDDEALLEKLADFLGFDRKPEPIQKEEDSGEGSASSHSEPIHSNSEGKDEENLPLEPVSFWMPVSMRYHGPALKVEEASPSIPWAGSNHEDDGDPSWRLRSLAPSWGPVREKLALKKPGHALDQARAVIKVAERKTMERLPRQSRSHFAGKILLAVDQEPSLVPFERDWIALLKLLRRHLPPEIFSPVFLPPACGANVIPLVLEELSNQTEGVLALTDFGGAGPRTSPWERLGTELARRSLARFALCPAPQSLPSRLSRLWNAHSWERCLSEASLSFSWPPALEEPSSEPLPKDPAVDRLLTLVSPVSRVSSDLLRQARTLVPGAEIDLAAEQRAWRDPRVETDGSSLRILGNYGDDFRRQWGELPLDLKTTLAQRFKESLQGGFPALWSETVLAMAAADQVWARQTLSKEVEQAKKAYKKAVTWLRQTGGQPKTRQALFNFLDDTLEDVPDAVEVHPELGLAHFLLRNPKSGDPIPASVDPAELELMKRDSKTPPPTLGLQLYQQGESIHLAPYEKTMAGRALSPLLQLQALTGGCVLSVGEPAADFSQEPFFKPPWASSCGEDEYGPWAVFRVGEAEQRMRWIRPGRFLMGSPKEEEGRDEDEGPQHWVRIPEGFWFGETPCTQAVWQEVMGENPSHFVGKDHPVEQVSWDDCQGFFEKLEAKLGNVGGFRLPKEAEWEYACRAGTTEARYDQDLDSIAWYAANSKKRTHPVGEKKANPWGLFDMLGNVFEWCADGQREYEDRNFDETPSGSMDGPLRVFRGGSWDWPAWLVRAACRHWGPRVDRNGYLGFRLAWVPRALQAEGASGERRKRSREDAPEAGKTQKKKESWWLSGEADQGLTLKPQELQLRTELMAVRFRRAIRPSRARTMFRDRFGLSMEYQLGKVRFRMRWIPPGRFQMGSPKSESGRFDQEGPQHWVVIDRGFWLGETPCTQALWQEVMGDNPSRFQGPERPVEKVSWDDCQKFLKRLEGRLNLQDGLHFSLPLEAEWEYACRAGTTEARYDQDLDSIAWYAANSKKRTHPVGEKKANPWGLFDMLGNVFEWCADGQREYGDRNFDETPSGSMDGPYRVRRGGSWYWRAWNVRAAYRYWSPRAYRYDNLGFRLARGPRALKS